VNRRKTPNSLVIRQQERIWLALISLTPTVAIWVQL